MVEKICGTGEQVGCTVIGF